MDGSSLAQNKVLFITVLSGLFAQFLKVVLYLFKEKKINFRRFVETGGMPSSHSASVAALSTAIGLSSGFGSTLFAVSAFFSFIVMYDAAGLRRAADRQARVLNKIIDDFQLGRQVGQTRLREFLGHTPIEVLAGGLLGILFALAFY